MKGNKIMVTIYNNRDVIKFTLNDVLMDYYLNKNEEVDPSALWIELNYHPSASRSGHFKLNLFTAMQQWNISDFKKFVDILIMSDEGNEAAALIHDFFLMSVNRLTKVKNQYDPKLDAALRKSIDTFVSRLIKFNDSLTCFGIEKIEAETAPKYKKCQVYSMTVIRGKRTVAYNDGYQFEKYGYIFQVYKRDGLNYIILPYVGLGVGSLKGNYRTAHEYIDENLIKIIKNPEKVEIINEARKDFIRLMSEEGYDVPEVCNDRSVFEPIETKEEAEESIKGEEKIKEKHIDESEDSKKESEKVNDSVSMKTSEESSENIPEEISGEEVPEKSIDNVIESIPKNKPCKIVCMTFSHHYSRNLTKTFYRVATVKTERSKRYASTLMLRFPLILASGPGTLKLKY